jgi:hypothetical protein
MLVSQIPEEKDSQGMNQFLLYCKALNILKALSLSPSQKLVTSPNRCISYFFSLSNKLSTGAFILAVAFAIHALK